MKRVRWLGFTIAIGIVACGLLLPAAPAQAGCTDIPGYANFCSGSATTSGINYNIWLIDSSGHDCGSGCPGDFQTGSRYKVCVSIPNPGADIEIDNIQPNGSSVPLVSQRYQTGTSGWCWGWFKFGSTRGWREMTLWVWEEQRSQWAELQAAVYVY